MVEFQIVYAVEFYVRFSTNFREWGMSMGPVFIHEVVLSCHVVLCFVNVSIVRVSSVVLLISDFVSVV